MSRSLLDNDLTLMGKLLLVVVFTLSFPNTAFPDIDTHASPNIILLLTDDQGWSEMSSAMDERIAEAASTYLQTPHMDQLARSGMRFTNGYSPAPLCTPTRRSILCGTSAPRSGDEFKSPWVPAEHLTIPQALKQANPAYQCAHFGKWGEQMISTPLECGYDTSDGMTGNNTGGMPGTIQGAGEDHGSGPPHFIDNIDPKRTPSLTARAIDFISEKAEQKQPFYMQVSFYATHLSVVCKEDTLKKYQAKGEPDRVYTPAWAAMMEELDQGIGQIIAKVDELDLKDSTYIFLTADNGGRGSIPGQDSEPSESSRKPTNYPLMGAKHSLYEGGIRVPFIARGPQIISGTAIQTPVVGYDFLPTFYELAGGREPLNSEVDGVSLVPLLHGNPDAFHRPQGALYFHRPGRMSSVIRAGQYKLFVHLNKDGSFKDYELFQVDPNPVETESLHTQQPLLAEQLFTQLTTYLAQVGSPLPEPNTQATPKPKKKPNKKSPQ